MSCLLWSRFEMWELKYWNGRILTEWGYRLWNEATRKQGWLIAQWFPVFAPTSTPAGPLSQTGCGCTTPRPPRSVQGSGGSGVCWRPPLCRSTTCRLDVSTPSVVLKLILPDSAAEYDVSPGHSCSRLSSRITLRSGYIQHRSLGLAVELASVGLGWGWEFAFLPS